jgi:phosphate transport system substrate-binding protein
MNKAKKSLLLVGSLLAIGMASCGKASFEDSKAITVVTREDGSGTKSAFMEIIGLKGQSDVTGAIVATGTAAVMAEVSGNKYAIAFDSLGYVTDEVKKLQVNSVSPTIATIKDGSYSIARPLSVVYKKATIDGSPLFTAYLNFLASKEAQSIISDNGYVSLKDDATNYGATSGLSGTIQISGSTSLQPLMILLANKFETLQAGTSVEVSGGGSGTGYSNAESGVSSFGMISASFDSAKAASCTSYVVAKDGIAVIVNKENTHDNISLDSLKSVYNSTLSDDARVNTWSEVK